MLNEFEFFATSVDFRYIDDNNIMAVFIRRKVNCGVKELSLQLF